MLFDFTGKCPSQDKPTKTNMKIMKTSKSTVAILAVGILSAIATRSAQATTAELELISGATTIIVPDNGAGDTNPATGAVVWSGTINGWTVTFAGGTTKPVIGSVTTPNLDISTFAVLSSGSGTLQVLFSDTGFGPTTGAADSLITGSIQGSQTVVFTTYGGNSNTIFDTSNLLTSTGTLSGNFPTQFASGVLGAKTGPYSLTEELTLTGSGNSSLDARLTVPDGGSTVGLLGLALVGLGIVHFRLNGFKGLVS